MWTSEESEEEEQCETEQESSEQGQLDISEQEVEELGFYPAFEKDKRLPTIGFIQPDNNEKAS